MDVVAEEVYCDVAFFGWPPEPNNNTTGAAINFWHNGNLLALFKHILPIDTKGVDPDRLMEVREGFKRQYEIAWFFVVEMFATLSDYNPLVPWVRSPCPRKGIEFECLVFEIMFSKLADDLGLRKEQSNQAYRELWL